MYFKIETNAIHFEKLQTLYYVIYVVKTPFNKFRIFINSVRTILNIIILKHLGLVLSKHYLDKRILNALNVILQFCFVYFQNLSGHILVSDEVCFILKILMLIS